MAFQRDSWRNGIISYYVPREEVIINGMKLSLRTFAYCKWSPDFSTTTTTAAATTTTLRVSHLIWRVLQDDLVLRAIIALLGMIQSSRLVGRIQMKAKTYGTTDNEEIFLLSLTEMKEHFVPFLNIKNHLFFFVIDSTNVVVLVKVVFCFTGSIQCKIIQLKLMSFSNSSINFVLACVFVFQKIDLQS